MAPRRKSTDLERPEGLSFEESLATLEAIVESMENQQIPLGDLVTQYEQGSKLLSHCETILSSARERIELITLQNQPENELESPAPRSLPADFLAGSDDLLTDSEDDDDIRLF